MYLAINNIGGDTIIYRVTTYINTYQITTKNYTIMKNNISISKFIQCMLMMIISACAAVIAILTIINCKYFCLMTNSYFIPYIIIICFTAISGIAFYTFYKIWYEMFIK